MSQIKTTMPAMAQTIRGAKGGTPGIIERIQLTIAAMTQTTTKKIKKATSRESIGEALLGPSLPTYPETAR
jgi:hypothetical protein